jgi:hypothetical protein
MIFKDSPLIVQYLLSLAQRVHYGISVAAREQPVVSNLPLSSRRLILTTISAGIWWAQNTEP